MSAPARLTLSQARRIAVRPEGTTAAQRHAAFVMLEARASRGDRKAEGYARKLFHWVTTQPKGQGLA